MHDIKIVTHNGHFHADELCAIASLSLFLEHSDFPAWRNRPVTIIRTRDESLMKTADFVVDVGAIYDEENNRFDHHQEGGAGARENTVPYSSFGLVWKKYGEHICSSIKAAERLDKKMVQVIDALDNGMNITTPLYPDIFPYTIQSMVNTFFPSWKEVDLDIDSQFYEMLEIIKKILRREIIKAHDSVEAEEAVKLIYTNTTDKQIIVLDKNYPAEILGEYPEPLFVVSPVTQSTNWKVNTVHKTQGTFESRKQLPEEWAGKRDQELQKITGIKDALFCHNKRFIAVSSSREGAVKLAEQALER